MAEGNGSTWLLARTIPSLDALSDEEFNEVYLMAMMIDGTQEDRAKIIKYGRDLFSLPSRMVLFDRFRDWIDKEDEDLRDATERFDPLFSGLVKGTITYDEVANEMWRLSHMRITMSSVQIDYRLTEAVNAMNTRKVDALKESLVGGVMTEDQADHARKMLDDVAGMATATSVPKSASMADAMAAVFEDYGVIRQTIPSGIAVIDNCVIGFEAGQLVVVAAPPSAGKSAAMISMSHHMACDGVRCGIVSAEMSAPDVTARLIGINQHVSPFDIRKQRLRPDDMKHHVDCFNATDVARLVQFSTKVETDCRKVYSICRSMAEDGCRVIFVDHLHRLSYPGLKQQSRYIEVSTMVRGFKSLAMECRVVLVLGCQMSKIKDERRPKRSDLRDAGTIDEEGDIVVLMHKANPQVIEAQVAKHRMGDTSEWLSVQWDTHTTRVA